jgi:cell division protease FtsH
MPDLEPVYKLTILPRGRTGGHALVVPEDDKDMMTRSEMIARLVFALGGRSAEELVFHEPTTGASSDIEQATKIARAMVTEYGMTARLGAVKYGKEEGDPFLGRTAGQQPNYSLEVAHEIDEEVRRLIEAAHTEAWEVLNTYRDVLDDLVLELIDKETLNRKDLERIFAGVQKRPRITAFNDFAGRTPSDKPPIKTPGELAKERGEPWPAVKEEPTPAPTPVPAGSQNGGPTHHEQEPTPAGAGAGAHQGTVQFQQPQQQQQQQSGQYGQVPQAVPPNYGAPPGWTPATTPSGSNYAGGSGQYNWTPSWERGQQSAEHPAPEQGESKAGEAPRSNPEASQDSAQDNGSGNPSR